MIIHKRLCTLSLLLLLAFSANWVLAKNKETPLKLNDQEYFEKQGVNAFVFSNWYNGLFSDSKISGIELIHHGVRTATNGDVRLHSTPEQWDAIPEFVERKVDREKQSIEAFLRYPNDNFAYSIRATAEGEKLLIEVILPQALPKPLEGKAGFNLEFLPARYFESTFIADNKPGYFPRYPSGPKEQNGVQAPSPLATAKRLTLAPTQEEKRISIHSNSGQLALFDGRGKAQNGWFVVRELLPANKKGTVLKWSLHANTVPSWLREPVISHSQLGYHPKQKKQAFVELDKLSLKSPNFDKTIKLFRIDQNGKHKLVKKAEGKYWGRYKRYDYLSFDFSEVKKPGIYQIHFGKYSGHPFQIADHLYQAAWQPTLDIFFPVQMDHVLVNEAYRVWHGASHLDDALQAPVNHEHFDLYAQGPTSDTAYKPGEHIPGLNIGGWYDAGDYDIRTQSQYRAVQGLVEVWENFRPLRDNTLVDYPAKFVDLHVPDGKPDILQQIEHGTLALIAQFRAVGHAIPGIIVPDLSQYTHLGDGLTMTDNLIYNPDLKELESNGVESGKFDDRWAFTTETTALNYGSIAALAAASRALKGYNDKLAQECLDTAIRAWQKEQNRDPLIFMHGNTTGGPLVIEKITAALELLSTTGDKQYKTVLLEHLADIEKSFAFTATLAARALPYMDASYKEKIRELTVKHKAAIENIKNQNPFGVLITEGGWAGNGAVIGMATTNYYLHLYFPDLIEKEDVFRGLNYILGTHPGGSISFVSGVGVHSKTVAYGMNRADFSFIAGGIVPGVLILKPDFPENKEDWPFLWGENEYVINLGASYIFLAHAVETLLNGK